MFHKSVSGIGNTINEMSAGRLPLTDAIPQIVMEMRCRKQPLLICCNIVKYNTVVQNGLTNHHVGVRNIALKGIKDL